MPPAATLTAAMLTAAMLTAATLVVADSSMTSPQEASKREDQREERRRRDEAEAGHGEVAAAAAAAAARKAAAAEDLLLQRLGSERRKREEAEASRDEAQTRQLEAEKRCDESEAQRREAEAQAARLRDEAARLRLRAQDVDALEIRPPALPTAFPTGSLLTASPSFELGTDVGTAGGGYGRSSHGDSLDAAPGEDVAAAWSSTRVGSARTPPISMESAMHGLGALTIGLHEPELPLQHKYNTIRDLTMISDGS